MWERAFRRVQLPLAYSEGFSPRPRVSFGLALPTGHESVAEFLDVELTTGDGLDLEGLDLEGLPARLSDALPLGVDATALAVLEPGTPSLQEAVTSCSWRWTAAPADGWTARPTAREVRARVAAVLRRRGHPRGRVTRKGKDGYRGRPGRHSAARSTGPGPGPIAADGILVSDGREIWPLPGPWTVRPAEVLLALGPGLEERHVRRSCQWIQRDGAARVPLAVTRDDATDAPHALERAS